MHNYNKRILNSDTAEPVIKCKKEKKHMRTSYAATIHDCNKNDKRSESAIIGHKTDRLVPGQTAANFGCLTKTEKRPEFESRSHYTYGENENSNFISSVKW